MPKGGAKVDIYDLLSIEGFVDYYCNYCAKMDELSKAKRELKKTGGGEDEKKAYAQEMHNLLLELHFVEDRYSRICTLSELQEALETYPEGSRERKAVKIVLERKQSMLKTLKECLDL